MVTRQAVHARRKRLGLTSPQPDWAARRALLIEDVEMLIQSGEYPVSIVQRMGYASTKSLARALRRAQRPDLARVIERRH